MRMTWATQPAATEIVGIVLHTAIEPVWLSRSQWPWHLWNPHFGIGDVLNPGGSSPCQGSCSHWRHIFNEPWTAPFLCTTLSLCEIWSGGKSNSELWIEMNSSQKQVGVYSSFEFSCLLPFSAEAVWAEPHIERYSELVAHLSFLCLSSPRLLTAWVERLGSFPSILVWNSVRASDILRSWLFEDTFHINISCWTSDMFSVKVFCEGWWK